MLARIQRRLGSLSNAERRVGAWLLAHPRQTADATLAEVARSAGVSEPTVVRFCRSIGLDGFRELTRRLTETLSGPASYIHRDVEATDTVPEVVSKVFDASIQALVNTRADIHSLPIEAVVDVLKTVRQIVFVGLGSSGYVAADAYHKFFRLGIPCSAMSDVPSILQFAALAGSGDAMIFVSVAGAWQDTASAAATAGTNGATVIALTNPSSDLAARAGIVLAIEATEDTSVYTPMTSRLAHLAVLDAIQVSLALALGQPASERLRASKSAISVRFSR